MRTLFLIALFLGGLVNTWAGVAPTHLCYDVRPAPDAGDLRFAPLRGVVVTDRGRTLNVTQQVTWTSFQPAVATATNEPRHRSRLVPRAPGTATIVATHPTGVSSHDTGDDATIEVRALAGLRLGPARAVGHVGDVLRFTLTADLGDGAELNLTQQEGASYWVTDGSVAGAFLDDGDRSAVHLFAPGTTTVSAAWSDYLTPARTVESSPVVRSVHLWDVVVTTAASPAGYLWDRPCSVQRD